MLKILILTVFLLQDLSTNNRTITIFTKDEQLPVYLRQLRALETDESGLKERDLVIRKIIYNSNTAPSFRKNNITGSFCIVLTGKDGGEKFRSTKYTSPQQLYSIIDAMPMRRSEIKSKR